MFTLFSAQQSLEIANTPYECSQLFWASCLVALLIPNRSDTSRAIDVLCSLQNMSIEQSIELHSRRL